MRFPLVLALALALVPALAGAGHAGVWKRTRGDGTTEFSNTPRGAGWALVHKGYPARSRAAGPPRTRTAARSAGSTVWTRQNADGTVEFTNISPAGARWKVLFKTGPGKAAALRGKTDRVPARDGSAARFSRYDEHIRDQQVFYGIPQALMRAIVKTESDFDPHVVSSVGAQGLTQLMPGTARDMGVTDVWDPRQNIMGGARYLQVLAKKYCKTPAGSGPQGAATGRVCSLEEKIKVIAGYHAGPGAVDRYGGMPPYETTRWYVTTVLRRYEEYRRREADQAWMVAAR